jgi:uncharacterized protein YqjF (DUF2071 family)
MKFDFLSETGHRPWPMPQRRWVLSMRWEDLLFAHWPVDPQLIAPFIPAGLKLEVRDGCAWIGVVPFRMVDTKPRFGPRVPGATSFPELNVRTYVMCEDKPGVWFFSLDAASWLVVRGARRFFHLPYFDARMDVSARGARAVYSSTRTHHDAVPAEFRAEYSPVGPVIRSVPGSIEHWLTERYCLYAADPSGTLWRCEIHHQQWPLQTAQAAIHANTMTSQLGFAFTEPPPLLHFSRGLDVVAWPIARCG